MSEDERLLNEARRAREEAEQARRHEDADADAGGTPRDTDPSPAEPWAKTSSGDADSVTDNGDEA